MLGFVSENIPTSGALGLAIMGGIGFLGGAIAQPVLGAIFDSQTATAIPADQVIDVLKTAVAGTRGSSYMGSGAVNGWRSYIKICCYSPCCIDYILYFFAFQKKMTRQPLPTFGRYRL